MVNRPVVARFKIRQPDGNDSVIRFKITMSIFIQEGWLRNISQLLGCPKSFFPFIR